MADRQNVIENWYHGMPEAAEPKHEKITKTKSAYFHKDVRIHPRLNHFFRKVFIEWETLIKDEEAEVLFSDNVNTLTVSFKKLLN